jgi:YhcH/YjgK/YiaL family protein
MILDRLENAKLYRPLSAHIMLALDYLRRTDFSQLPAGRQEVHGDRVWAIVQRYRPKPLDQIAWEAHRQYIDVQYVAVGTERMGYVPLDEGLTVRQAYDVQKDAILFDAAGDLFTLSAGGFAIFTPYDVHAPGLARDLPESAAEVCKVVMKCRVE